MPVLPVSAQIVRPKGSRFTEVWGSVRKMDVASAAHMLVKQAENEFVEEFDELPDYDRTVFEMVCTTGKVHVTLIEVPG